MTFTTRPLLFFSAAKALAVTCAAATVFAFPAATVAADDLGSLIERQVFGLGAHQTPQDGSAALPGFGTSTCPFQSMDRVIGQMLMVGFEGRSSRAAAAKRLQRQLRRGDVGGVILMGRNIGSKAQLRGLTRSFTSSGATLPPLIGIDQEGGAVTRLRPKLGYRYTPSAARVARRYSPERAQSLYRRLGSQLNSFGINLNFGPVTDLNINPRNPIIGRKWRSYGAKAETVISYAKAFVAGHRASGVLTSLKHFPGHGSSRRDSHKGFVNISGTWREAELAPYRSMIASGHADTIMVGHLYHKRFAGTSRLPATLSAPLVTGVLRKQLGFHGVIITDDMNMGAIKSHYSRKRAVVRAINAGNDILLFSSSSRASVQKLHAIIKGAVERGEIERATLNAACSRIAKLKQRLQ